jgi:hypothetical protein
MGMRTGMNVPAVLIDKYINSAYDVVKVVSDNIGDVNIVNNSIENVNINATNISDINRLADSADNIDVVRDSITSVDTLAIPSNLLSINTVSDDINNTNIVANDISNVNTVATNILNVNTTATNISNVNTTAENIISVNTNAVDIENINTNALNIESINTVSLDINNVNIVSSINNSVNVTANNISDIVILSDNISDVQIVASISSDVTNVSNNVIDINQVSADRYLAQVARISAEAAADVAQLSAGVYATTVAGLAATTTGHYFSVPSSDSAEYLILYLNNAGAAVEQKRYPSVAGVNAYAQVLRHIPSPATLVEDAGVVSLPSGVKDVVAITDTTLNSMGYFFANRLDNLAAVEENYALIVVPSAQKKFGFGDYVAMSVLIQTADWAGVDTGRIRGFAFGEVQQSYVLPSYDDLGSGIRRYYGVFQITNASLLNLSYMWIEVTTKAGRSAPVFVTGLIAAVSDNKPYGVIWRDAADWQRRMNLLDAAEVDRVQGRGMLQPIISPSLTLEDAGANSMSTINRDVRGLSDNELNLMGYVYAQWSDNTAAVEDSYGIVKIPDTEKHWKTGDWVALSVFILTADWDNVEPSRIRGLLFNRGGGQQTLAPMTQYEEIGKAALRRYHGVFQITSSAITDLEKIWIEVTGKAGRAGILFITGYMAAVSSSKPTGLDWRGAYGRYVDAVKLDTAATQGNVLKTMVPNGQMINGETSGVVLGSGTSVAITDTELNNLGITHAIGLTNTSASQDCYGRLIADSRYYGAGDWLAYSFFVKTADFSGIDTARLRALCLPVTGGGVQTIVTLSSTQYEVIRSDLRRYYGAYKIPSGITDINQVWMEVTALAGRSAAVYVAGHAAALSRFSALGVDWADYDPYAEAATNTRLTAIETVIDSNQTEAKLLVPSSFHLVQGRPLTLYRSGLSELGRADEYEIAFVGRKDGLPFVKYVDEQIDIDGSRLSGSGFVYSRSKTSTTPKWRRPVTFYSSAATKTGNPNILVIGDSLTQEGTVTALKNKLVAAGVTPTFLGTVKDDGGTLCEGRPSWEFSDFTRKYTEIFAGQPTYPIDATGGDGVVTTVAQYLALGDSANYGPRWKYNPFVRPTVGGDDPALVKNGYVFDVSFYLSRFSFSTLDVVMIALGTNDINSNPSGTAVANIAEGLQIMVDQIRAAAPSCKIGILFKDSNSTAITAIRASMQTYGAREGEGLFILPIFSVLDPFLSYGADGEVTINSTDSIGVQNLTQNDLTHMDSNGKEQWAEMTFAFVMNRI